MLAVSGEGRACPQPCVGLICPCAALILRSSEGSYLRFRAHLNSRILRWKPEPSLTAEHADTGKKEGYQTGADHANRFRRAICTKTCGASPSANGKHNTVTLRYHLPRHAWANICSLWTVVRDCASWLTVSVAHDETVRG